MAKILFLPSWYPSRVDAFEGDYIERHAAAASLTNRVCVIFIKKDTGIMDGKAVLEKQVSGNLVTYRVYYPSGSSPRIIEGIRSTWLGFRLFRKAYKTAEQEFGVPDIVHLNVLMKAGLYAWWLKMKYRIPFVLTEHWSGYYKERKDGYRQRNIGYRFFSKKIYRNCRFLLPVTHDLGRTMNELLGKIPFRVIPNVVDTSLFYPVTASRLPKKRFIHASTMGYHKNIEGLLRTAKNLYRTRQDFELYLAGPPSPEMLRWTTENGLQDTCIFFTGLIPYSQVAEYVRGADALVMFSRNENLPCAILEALACGLPVIATDVGGIREVIGEKNGLLIPSEREDELLKAMNQLLDTLDRYDKQEIARCAKNKFSYEAVARELDEVYKMVLKDQDHG